MKKIFLLTIGLTAFGVLNASGAAAQTSHCDWSGAWETSRGDLTLKKSDGVYAGNSGEFGRVTGIGYLTGHKCELYGVFRTSDGNKQGEFKLKQNSNSFSGQWNDVKGRPWAHSWTGTRSNSDQQSSTSSANRFGVVTNGNLSGQTFATAKVSVPKRPLSAVVNPPVSSNNEPTPEDVKKLKDTLAALEAQKRDEEIALAVGNLRRLKKGEWRVDLEAICAWTADEKDWVVNENYENYYGIGWIRARVIHKKTKQQIDLAPKGGFTNLNGDKERVWEVKPSDLNQFQVTAGECGTIRRSFTYEVDFAKYGYDSLIDFLGEPKNRFDVMFKLTEHDKISADDYLGTKRAATSFQRSSFCNICGNYGSLPKFRNNNGMLNGFKGDGTNVSVAYGIVPGFNVKRWYYDLRLPERGSIRSEVVSHFD